MDDWLQRLLFDTGDLGLLGIAGNEDRGLNFDNPPADMTSGLNFTPPQIRSDPSQLADQNLAAAPQERSPTDIGGIFDRRFWDAMIEQARKDWEKRGSPPTEFKIKHMEREAPALPALPDIMGYVSRSKNQRRERPAARVNSYEYLKGLLG